MRQLISHTGLLTVLLISGLLSACTHTLAPLPDNCPAIQPVSQNRDASIYDYMTRHREILERNKAVKPDIVMLGDSITHYWGGDPKAKIARDETGFHAAFPGKTVTNLGYGWDRTENMLWRIENGELDGIAPEKIFLLIGTNNLPNYDLNTTVSGIDAVWRKVREKLPDTKIVMLSILPRANANSLKCTPDAVNARVKALLQNRSNTEYLDLTPLFLTSGTLDAALFSDGLHPNFTGYRLMSYAIRTSQEK